MEEGVFNESFFDWFNQEIVVDGIDRKVIGMQLVDINQLRETLE